MIAGAQAGATLLSPGGAGAGNQSALNPQSPQRGRQQPAAPNTFRSMREQGVARPARGMVPRPQPVAPQAPQSTVQATQPVQAPQPMAAPVQAPQPASQPALQDTLQQQIMSRLTGQNRELEDAAYSRLARESGRLGEQYDTQSDAMEENYAARGLDASTIAATGVGKLRGEQARSLSDLSAQTEESLQAQQAAAAERAIGNALGLNSQLTQQDQFGQTYDLNAELGRGNLGLSRDRLSMDRDNSAFDRTYKNSSLDLQRENLAFGRETDARDFNYGVGRDAVGDSRYADATTYTRGRDAASDSYRDSRDSIDDTRYTDDRDYGRGRDALSDERFTEGRTYDRGRDALSDTRYADNTTYSRGRDATSDQRYADETTYGRGRDVTNDAARNRALGQGDTSALLQFANSMGMGNIDPAILSSIFKSMGIDPATLTNKAGNNGSAPGTI